MTRHSRRAWGARPATGGPGRLDPAAVVGLAFHWPAMAHPLRGRAQVVAALLGWQAYHMDGRGWSDIAYQVAVDQDGDRWTLRGLGTVSAANGDTAVNRTYGAVLLILAPGEHPTPAMVAEVRRVVKDHRRRFPRSTRLVGHGEIRPEPTACPGPIAQHLIDTGAFEPARSNRVTRARRDLREAQGELADVAAARTQVGRARELLAKLLRVLPER